MDRRIFEVLEILEEEWDKPLCVPFLAERVNLGARRLRQLFRDEMGICVTQYLKKKRLENAAELLLSTHEQVSEICYCVGYDDPGYFTKLFKRSYGSSPSDYRQAKWQEQEISELSK